MTKWDLFGLMCAAGAVGGLINMILNRTAFLPSFKARPVEFGALGSVLVGAVAAGLSWALYGPLADAAVAGRTAPDESTSLTFAALAGGVLIGISGVQWIKAEVDKRGFQAASVAAAGGDADPGRAASLAAARSGAEALRITGG